jgi:hypothetical protein
MQFFGGSHSLTSTRESRETISAVSYFRPAHQVNRAHLGYYLLDLGPETH